MYAMSAIITVHNFKASPYQALLRMVTNEIFDNRNIEVNCGTNARVSQFE